jgi:hypothetical protein
VQQALTKALGFSNVSFPPTRAWSDVNLEQLVNEGQVIGVRRGEETNWPSLTNCSKLTSAQVSPLLYGHQSLSRLEDYGEGIEEPSALAYIANALEQLTHVRAAGQAKSKH